MRLRTVLILALLALIVGFTATIFVIDALNTKCNDCDAGDFFAKSGTVIAATNNYVGTAIAATSTAHAVTRQSATRASQ